MHFMDILFILEKDSLCYSLCMFPCKKNTDFHILDKTDKNLTGDVVTNLGEVSVHFVTPPRADLPNWVDLGTNFLEGGAV